jgi:hypothetical protein
MPTLTSFAFSDRKREDEAQRLQAAQILLLQAS